MHLSLIHGSLLLLLCVCLTNIQSQAADIPVIDPQRDTVSPVYSWTDFPYSWEEIRQGKFNLMPVHWNRSAASPVVRNGMNSRPVKLDDDTIRVYFGQRGPTGGICYFDVDPRQPEKLKGKVAGPIITTGTTGSYDDDWVLCPEPVWISKTHLRMYYAAKKKGGFFSKVWSLACADSKDGGKTWTKYTGNPIMTATENEWESGAVGFTSVEKHDDGYRMWYLGTNTSKDAIKQVGYATSQDGYKWDRYAHNPVIAVNPSLEWERGAIAVARTIRDDRFYRTWYCCYPNNNTYAIGCAESVDGIRWTRSPANPILKGSGKGWDSSMAAYPGTIRIGDKFLMWYSGNGYGSAGIGLATAVVPRGTWCFRTGTNEKIDDGWTSWEEVLGKPIPTAKFIQFAVIASRDSSGE